MTEPLVNIIITTYNRLDLLVPTIKALIENLKYSNLGWILADDGSHETYIDQAVRQASLQVPFAMTQAGRKGVGFSKNLALRHAFEQSPYVLLMEDDWQLKEPLNLSRHVALMEARSDVGMIRFGYLGGRIEAVYDDLNGFDTSYWELKSGVYCYSGQVSLRSKVWYDQIGYHAENCSPGAEELDMCYRYAQIQNPPKILWAAEYGCKLNCGPFINIGMNNSTNGVQPT